MHWTPIIHSRFLKVCKSFLCCWVVYTSVGGLIKLQYSAPLTNSKLSWQCWPLRERRTANFRVKVHQSWTRDKKNCIDWLHPRTYNANHGDSIGMKWFLLPRPCFISIYECSIIFQSITPTAFSSLSSQLLHCKIGTVLNAKKMYISQLDLCCWCHCHCPWVTRDHCSYYAKETD